MPDDQSEPWISQKVTNYLRTLTPKQVSPIERLVLYALGFHMNDDGQCRPSLDTLMAQTSLTRGHLRRVLAELERRGFLDVDHYRPEAGQPRRPTHYTLRPGEARAPTLRQQRAKDAQNVLSMARYDAQNVLKTAEKGAQDALTMGAQDALSGAGKGVQRSGKGVLNAPNKKEQLRIVAYDKNSGRGIEERMAPETAQPTGGETGPEQQDRPGGFSPSKLAADLALNTFPRRKP